MSLRNFLPKVNGTARGPVSRHEPAGLLRGEVTGRAIPGWHRDGGEQGSVFLTIYDSRPDFIAA